ncbi:MAG: ABC transporter ATP-binding protein, partial [Usitatibacter sp.]
MAIAIHLQDCAKTFVDGTRALEPLTLDIAAGETVVLLGPSGCGKTTTLRIIAGLESPDPGGRVLFDTEDVTAQPIEQRGVGMVFQSYALFPNMTVAENVAYGLRVRKTAAHLRANRVAEMLALVDLGSFGNRRVDQLSGGQKQRVALARALAIQPRVLLLDEPLTALDAKLREQLRVEIDRLLRQLGITAVYVTHDQAEAMALGDRIVVMEKGRIAQAGTPQEIYHHPATAFVADFIGTMNRMTRDGREVMFRPEDVRIVAAGGHDIEAKVISS